MSSSMRALRAALAIDKPRKGDNYRDSIVLYGSRMQKQRRLQAAALIVTAVLFLFAYSHCCDTLQQVQSCAIENLHRDLSFLDEVYPISPKDFLTRRDYLAQALHRESLDAFVVEPGYTFQFYANVSQQDWEPWEPEERPFLMIVEPVGQAANIKAKTTFLSAHFEEGRVRMLGIPSVGPLNIVIWEEDWNPYETLKRELFDNKNVTLMIDEEMRDFIVRGLTNSGIETKGLCGEVEAVKQIKTNSEIDILRAVNTGTVEAIRAVRKCLVPGLTENEVTTILDNTMLSVGFSLFFNIVLFESNAALPHGGFATGDKILEYETMVLIDVGSHYLGYSSDISRSFFISPKDQFPNVMSKALHEEKVKVWNIVLEAQSKAAEVFRPGNSAASVDIAARKVIDDAGYEGTFTHRLGHSIGIKAHESPYLNKGNNYTVLLAGMVFTAEPGIYLQGRFGVRHEDVYLIKEHGAAEVLSGQLAAGPYNP